MKISLHALIRGAVHIPDLSTSRIFLENEILQYFERKQADYLCSPILDLFIVFAQSKLL